VHHNRGVREGLSGLYITFNRSPPSVKTLREILAHTHKLEDLRLEIPNYSRLCWGRVFDGLYCRYLSLLQTSASHDILANFLRKHPQIEFINITSPCNRRRGVCTLARAFLPNLVDLTGPTSCVAEIPDNNPIRSITMNCFTAEDEEYCFRCLPTSIYDVRLTLTRLILGFDPIHHGILRRIHTAAPSLRELGLYETKQINIVSTLFSSTTRALTYLLQSRGPLFPRPWDDLPEWARDLACFSHLRSFSLSTYAQAIRNKGNVKEELTLAFQWTSGQRRCRRRKEQTITRIALRYLQGTADETVTVMDFMDGKWVKGCGA
jgi:hypothetical protein